MQCRHDEWRVAYSIGFSKGSYMKGKANMLLDKFCCKNDEKAQLGGPPLKGCRWESAKECTFNVCKPTEVMVRQDAFGDSVSMCPSRDYVMEFFYQGHLWGRRRNKALCCKPRLLWDRKAHVEEKENEYKGPVG